MPHLTLPIQPSGAILELLVGVSTPRASALKLAGHPVPAAVVVRGLIDTGASCTCVDIRVLSKLGVAATGIMSIHTPSTKDGQPHTANQFDVSLLLQHPKLSWQFHAVPVIDAHLAHQGFDALIGRDILSNCLLSYDGQARTFAISF